MFSKLVSLVLVLCVYNVAAVTYEEAFSSCKTKFNLQNDAPLDYFMANGKFETGKENLKCFFECLASDLGVKSADGSVNGEALKKLAQSHTHCQELALFGSEEVLKQCIKSSYTGTESCDKVFEFIQCSVQLKIASSKSS
ncbi:uncharacterized protein LOC135832184 [Planococcus citri]|uniref:uncharacterized protein LOC135832184 n=1 Tax=Planococcus citri TaxID=170843 RepID=UPI0031F9F5AF